MNVSIYNRLQNWCINQIWNSSSDERKIVHLKLTKLVAKESTNEFGCGHVHIFNKQITNMEGKLVAYKIWLKVNNKSNTSHKKEGETNI